MGVDSAWPRESECVEIRFTGVSLARQIDNIPERPPNRDIRQLTRVLRFLWPYRARMAVAGTALVVAAGCVLLLGQGPKRVIHARFSRAHAASLGTALFPLLPLRFVLRL